MGGGGGGGGVTYILFREIWKIISKPAMHGRTVFSILVSVRLYTVRPEVCHWLTNETREKLILI